MQEEKNVGQGMDNHEPDDEETPEFSDQQLKEAMATIELSDLPPAIKDLVIKCLKCVSTINAVLNRQRVSIRRLRRLFGIKTEKKSKNTRPKGNPSSPSPKNTGKDGKKGHGKNSHNNYPGSQVVIVPHQTLSAGADCPLDDCDGKVYAFNYGIYVRITGGPLLTATTYKTEKFRCNLCLTIFEAALAACIKNAPKYDNRALAIMILSRYFLATPFNRSRELQDNLGVPLPASTCSEKIALAWQMLSSLFLYLSYAAAQAGRIGFDDTKINFRRGYNTSVLVASGEKKIILFRTGRQHAGENFRDLMRMREDGLPTPIAASDGLECYFPHKSMAIDVRCMAHARRKFYELEKTHPALHANALGLFGQLFANDTKTEAMEDDERLKYHQEHSRNAINALVDLAENEIEKLEPSSEEYKACDYLIRNWNPLSAFIRVPGAPLSTNEEERMAKQIIKIRKNSLFFKTAKGAHMADDLIGLIETCRANGVNAFDYLEWALDNHKQVAQAPMKFTPWEFKRLGTSPPENRQTKDYHWPEGPEVGHGLGPPPPQRSMATNETSPETGA